MIDQLNFSQILYFKGLSNILEDKELPTSALIEYGFSDEVGGLRW